MKYGKFISDFWYDFDWDEVDYELIFPPIPWYGKDVLRAKDLLNLKFRGINLELHWGDSEHCSEPHLARSNDNLPAYFLVGFPPQSFAEEAFSSIIDEYNSSMRIFKRISNESRLVFLIPKDIKYIKYNLHDLLSWQQFKLSVAPVAQKTIRKPPIELGPYTVYFPPGELEIEYPYEYTFIEAPYRLMLSPNNFAGWAHSNDLVFGKDGHGEVTELWHTRLGIRKISSIVDESDEYRDFKTLAAIWSPDYALDCKDDSSEGKLSLNSAKRNKIVHQTSDSKVPHKAPVQSNLFMLTAIGAWANLHGMWNPNNSTCDICEWVHISTMGREHYVKAVQSICLFPTGHRAAIEVITERQIGDSPMALLHKISFLTVIEPEKVYEKPDPENKISRQMPFRRIRIMNPVTPMLDDPPTKDNPWPKVDGTDFYFHLIAEDWDGQVSEFKAPLRCFFAKKEDNIDNIIIDDIISKYEKSNAAKIDLCGQKVSFTGDQGGATSFATNQIDFGAWNLNKEGANIPGWDLCFYPKVVSSEVRLPAVQQFSGKECVATIKFSETYLTNGFDKAENPGMLFASLVKPAQYDLNFKTDRSGGLATPDMKIKGLSSKFGLVGDLEKHSYSNGSFFEGYFNNAKLLGGIELGEIIEDGLENIPKILNISRIDEDNTPIEETKFEWAPVLKSSRIFNKNTNASLKISATMATKGSQSVYDISGNLSDFTINFLDIIKIPFKSLTFTSRNGEKLDVSAIISPDGIKFIGILEFLDKLRSVIKPDGFNDPPSLDVTADGVSVRYTLPIPTIAMGAFSLQNISLSSELNLPFNGEAMWFRFAFAEKHDPFLLAISLFGGGGFFAAELGTDGIRDIAASLEFGGNFSLDIGVASGGVYVMAGIYFRYGTDKEGKEDLQLSGYLRCGGAMEVLCIATVSVEFYLILDYYSDTKEIGGRASLRVKVEIAFFSKSVNLEVERRFSSGSKSLGFEDLISHDDWDRYCNAFAEG